jgi:hypothetical protein
VSGFQYTKTMTIIINLYNYHRINRLEGEKEMPSGMEVLLVDGDSDDNAYYYKLPDLITPSYPSSFSE